MVNVYIRYNQSKEFESLKLCGHANSGPYGHDLVCAAISGVVLGGINNLQGKYDIIQNSKTGSLELIRSEDINDYDKIVLETIIVQLKSIARDNPKNVKISVVN